MKKEFLINLSDSKKWIMIAVLIILGIIFSNNTFAKDLKKLDEKSFDVKPGEKLTVSASVADVDIRTWDKNEFNIKVFGNNNAEERMEFFFEKTSTGVRVKTEKRGNWISNLFWSNIQVKFEIMVPKNFDLDITTSGGDITVGNLIGKMALNTSGGDIKLSVTEGDLKATTSGGDIKLYKQSGSSYVDTSGGDIIIKESTGKVDGSTSGGDINADIRNGKVNLDTSGGDIKLWYSGENYGIALGTSGGDIAVYLPSSFKANAHLSTSGGDVSCKINATSTTKKSSHKFIAELNGGGEKLTVETSGGDITVLEK